MDGYLEPALVVDERAGVHLSAADLWVHLAGPPAARQARAQRVEVRLVAGMYYAIRFMAALWVTGQPGMPSVSATSCTARR